MRDPPAVHIYRHNEDVNIYKDIYISKERDAHDTARRARKVGGERGDKRRGIAMGFRNLYR